MKRLILMALLLAGCASGNWQAAAFNDYQRAFDALPADPETGALDRRIPLALTIHIVGERAKFQWDRAAAPGSAIAGYADTSGRIAVFGKVVKDRQGRRRIIVNQAVLGHELQHLLHWADPEIADPDR